MAREIKFKKCSICGRVVKVENDEPVICCEKEMEYLLPNTVDCAVEKHIPTYERVEDEIFVKVNHVMEKEHFIEWICMVSDEGEKKVQLYPEQEASARFPYIKGARLYAYCNKHGLWEAEVK
ncbi:MAG: desulfoferrodoxin family protein [Clostridia bacterium]